MKESQNPIKQMNSSSLKNKHILLAVTGGIAAYKATEIVRRLKAENASVTVLMTEASRQFITPLTFESLTGNKVYTDIFSAPLSHINLPESADAFVIAPATANIIGKIASGIADDMVALSLLAFRGPVIFAPAMNWRMYEHPVVRRNLKILREMGLYEVIPDEGELACGGYGVGRMASIERIIEAVKGCLCRKDLAGLRVVVTAGPTREYIDPVRFISNRSSGKMGYALAEVAMRRGADVTLISGPTSIEPPSGVDIIRVETSKEMSEAVKGNIKGAQILVMAAAVADFVPEDPSSVKKEKETALTLKLRPAADIIKTVTKKKGLFVIGFSAETGPNIAKAKKKLREKGMDFIVFNDVTLDNAGFDSDMNKISIIDRKGVRDYPLTGKEECAERIFDSYLMHTK